MGKSDIALYEALCEAQMPKAQALASQLLPDWSQFATKQDMERLERDMERLEHRLKQDMASLEHRLDQKISALNLKISENHTALIRWQWGQRPCWSAYWWPSRPWASDKLRTCMPEALPIRIGVALSTGK